MAAQAPRQLCTVALLRLPKTACAGLGGTSFARRLVGPYEDAQCLCAGTPRTTTMNDHKRRYSCRQPRPLLEPSAQPDGRRHVGPTATKQKQSKRTGEPALGARRRCCMLQRFLTLPLHRLRSTGRARWTTWWRTKRLWTPVRKLAAFACAAHRGLTCARSLAPHEGGPAAAPAALRPPRHRQDDHDSGAGALAVRCLVARDDARAQRVRRARHRRRA